MPTYYELNKEKILERIRKQKEDNPDRFKEYKKNWREKNKDYMKDYYQKNKDKIKAQAKAYYYNGTQQEEAPVVENQPQD